MTFRCVSEVLELRTPLVINPGQTRGFLKILNAFFSPAFFWTFQSVLKIVFLLFLRTPLVTDPGLTRGVLIKGWLSEVQPPWSGARSPWPAARPYPMPRGAGSSMLKHLAQCLKREPRVGLWVIAFVSTLLFLQPPGGFKSLRVVSKCFSSQQPEQCVKFTTECWI